MGLILTKTALGVKKHEKYLETEIRRYIDHISFKLLDIIHNDGLEVCKNIQIVKKEKSFTARINLTVKSKHLDINTDDLEPLVETDEGE